MFNPYDVMRDYPNWYNEISYEEFVKKQFPEKFLEDPYENIKLHFVLDEVNEMIDNNEESLLIKQLKENVMKKRNIPEEKIDDYIKILIDSEKFIEYPEGYLRKITLII